MLTNPIPPMPAAQPDGDRPQLRIAARATSELRENPPPAAAVIALAIGESHAQWRQTLDMFKSTLVSLEETCESALDAQQSKVAGLIDTLVQAAAAEANALASQTRDQAQVTITELQQSSMALQATVQTLETALEEEREHFKRLTVQLERDAEVRARIEAERDACQQHFQREAAAAEAVRAELRASQAELHAREAELSTVRVQLESAHAECSKLTTTFRLVQRAMALTHPAVTLPVESADDALATPVDTIAPPQPAEHAAPAATTPNVPAEVTPVDPRIASIDAHPEAAEGIGQLLEQIESMYTQDVDSGWAGIEMVDRLTANLRHARSISGIRWDTENFDARGVFDYYVDLLLDRHAGTAFARHLGIAAYTLRTPEPAVSDAGAAH